MSLIRMLRQFHYIDMNGKDQGINVRNRSSELVKLLGDVDQIRTERKKARANRNKFGGFEGGMGVGGISGGSSGRYGGFGSDSVAGAGYGGYSGGVFGDGGGFGGASSEFQESSTSSSARRGNRFDEYDEYDEGDAVSARPAAPPKQKKPEPAPAPPPVENMLDFDDEPVTTSSTSAGKQPSGSAINMLDNADDDDDFDDFQSATPAPSAPASNQFSIQPPASTGSTNTGTQFVAPQPVSGSQGANLNGLVGFTSATPTPPASSIASPVSQTASIQQPQIPKPTGYQAKGPNYFTSVPISSSQSSSHATTPSLSSPQSGAASNKPAASAAKPSGDAFGSLWSTASASAGITKSNTGANKGPNLNSMAKEKASAGIWGAPASSTPQTQQKPAGGSAFDDLLG